MGYSGLMDISGLMGVSTGDEICSVEEEGDGEEEMEP